MKIVLLMLFIATSILMARFDNAKERRWPKRLATLRSRQFARKE